MSIKKVVRRSGAGIWWLLSRLVPKHPRLVVLNTFPDFDDTSRAMVVATREKGYRLVILTTQNPPALPAWAASARVSACYRYSLKGIWLYHRARFVFYTHGLFSAWPLSDKQCVVNVWHGMPIKRIGLLDGKSPEQIPRFHYTIASNEVFRSIVCEAFGVRPEQVLLADHPRIDILKARTPTQLPGLPKHDLLAVWLPTYRASKVGDIRADGSSRGDIFSGEYDMRQLDEFFVSRGVVCVIKPHPMAKASAAMFKDCKALVFFDEQELLRRNLTLYQLLSYSDFMITDVSSVYVDYAVLGRPMVVFCPDLDEYRTSRGFTAPIESIVTHRIAVSEVELFDRIDEIVRASGASGWSGSSSAESPACTLRLFKMLESRVNM